MAKKKCKHKKTASEVGKFSRKKGKRFECQMARYFTAWTGVEWSTTRNSGRFDLKGDVYCVSKPDSPLIVECKHRKAYTVHAMLKPTKAFTDMIKESKSKINYNQFMMFIVKNETGVWISCEGVIDVVGSNSTGMFTLGTMWCKLRDFETLNTEIGGIRFVENPKIY